MLRAPLRPEDMAALIEHYGGRYAAAQREAAPQPAELRPPTAARPCGAFQSIAGPIGTMPVGLIERWLA